MQDTAVAVVNDDIWTPISNRMKYAYAYTFVHMPSHYFLQCWKQSIGRTKAAGLEIHMFRLHRERACGNNTVASFCCCQGSLGVRRVDIRYTLLWKERWRHLPDIRHRHADLISRECFEDLMTKRNKVLHFFPCFFFTAFPREEVSNVLKAEGFSTFPCPLLFRLPFYYLGLGHRRRATPGLAWRSS